MVILQHNTTLIYQKYLITIYPPRPDLPEEDLPLLPLSPDLEDPELGVLPDDLEGDENELLSLDLDLLLLSFDLGAVGSRLGVVSLCGVLRCLSVDRSCLGVADLVGAVDSFLVLPLSLDGD